MNVFCLLVGLIFRAHNFSRYVCSFRNMKIEVQKRFQETSKKSFFLQLSNTGVKVFDLYLLYKMFAFVLWEGG